MTEKDLQTALKKFTGAHRRFEFKGKVNGASIYDDYGHHPTEIVATSKSVANKKHNKSWVVFQPHTYSRTKNLLDDFANALIRGINMSVEDYSEMQNNLKKYSDNLYKKSENNLKNLIGSGKICL